MQSVQFESLDIISELPPEILTKILFHLIENVADTRRMARNMGNLLQVSKSWNYSFFICEEFWKFMCDRRGFKISDTFDSYGKLYQTLGNRLLCMNTNLEGNDFTRAQVCLQKNVKVGYFNLGWDEPINYIDYHKGVVAYAFPEYHDVAPTVHFYDLSSKTWLGRFSHELPSGFCMESLRIKDDALAISYKPLEQPSLSTAAIPSHIIKIWNMNDRCLLCKKLGKTGYVSLPFRPFDFSIKHRILAMFADVSEDEGRYVISVSTLDGKKELLIDDMPILWEELTIVPMNMTLAFDPKGEAVSFFAMWQRENRMVVHKISSDLLSDEGSVVIDRMQWNPAERRRRLTTHAFETFHFTVADRTIHIVGSPDDQVCGEIHELDFGKNDECFVGQPTLLDYRISLRFPIDFVILGAGKKFVLLRYFDYPSQPTKSKFVLKYCVYRLPTEEERKARKQHVLECFGTMDYKSNGRADDVLADRDWLDGLNGINDCGPVFIRCPMGQNNKRMIVHLWKK